MKISKAAGPKPAVFLLSGCTLTPTRLRTSPRSFQVQLFGTDKMTMINKGIVITTLCAFFIAWWVAAHTHSGFKFSQRVLPLQPTPEVVFAGSCIAPAPMTDGVDSREPASFETKCPESSEDWAKEIQKNLKRSDPLRLDDMISGLIGLRNRCQPDAKISPVVEKCLAPLINIQDNFKEFPTLSITEKVPRVKTPLVLPEEFKKFGELLKSISSNGNIDKQRAELIPVAASFPEGSKTMEFVSNTIGEHSYVTAIPGESADIFVHGFAGENTYFVLRAVKKLGNETLPLPVMDYFVTSGSNPLVGDPSQQNRCVSCHRAGTIKILPKAGTIHSLTAGTSDTEIMLWFDQMRTRFADFSNWDTSHLGPEMGPEDPPFRTVDAVRKCASVVKPDVTTEEVEVIRKQMNCEGCHFTDGPGTDVLRFPMHALNLKFKIFDNIILSGYMPKHPKTPENLRKPLLACLKAEYFGGFSQIETSNREPGILMRSLMSPECPYMN
jgi:hypothetical protein